MAEKTMTLGQLYKDYASRGARQKKAATVLNQIDWLTCNAEFDPISGMPTPMPLTKFIFRVARRDVTNDDFPHERLWHLVDHCSEAVVRLIRYLNENPARDHEFMHIRQVKELDAPSFVKLSTRPGRNIREKLSSNPYLQAVKRYMSVDLAENRLFKAFLRRLYELLELRYEMMKAVRGDTAEAHPLMDEINRWLRSDVADEISDWENTPPNNTLLSHKNYKKVWDAWRWMLTLDEDVNRDYSMNDESEMRRRENLVRFWDEYALAWKRADNVRMAEVPLFFDYDKFEIKVWGDSDVIPLVDNGIRLIEIGDLKASARIGCRGNSGQIRRPKEISDPACVDLTWLSPRYAIDDKIRTLPVRLIWQNWAEKPEDAALAKNANGVAKNVAFSLFGADAIWQHPDTTTIAFADLFAGADCKAPDELQWRAAHASTEELNRIFTNETIVWLMPDGISEFELKVIRGSLNAVFKNAQPLPRSIAAICEKVDFTRLPRERIQKKGYGVLVLDTTDDGVLATKMTAKYSEELEKKVPSTLGYYWERNPSVLLTDETVRQSALSEIDYIGENGEYRGKSKQKVEWRQFDKDELLRRGDLGDFGYVVNLTTSPVVGGLKLYKLQQVAGDLPLWRDNLQLLSMGGVKDENGMLTNFSLVGPHTGSVVPLVGGEEVYIPVGRMFYLPCNQPHYWFSLHQGKGNRSLNEVAFVKPERPIRSDDPQKQVLKCRLKLTYKYGADYPYRLVFYPHKEECVKFAPMVVKWISVNKLMELIELPAPTFPAAKTWGDLQASPTPDGIINMLELLRKALVPICGNDDALVEYSIDSRVNTIRKYRVIGKLRYCRRDSCIVSVDGEDVVCRYTEFVEESFSSWDLKEGSEVYLQVNRYHDKCSNEIHRRGEFISVREEFPESEIRKAVLERVSTLKGRENALKWVRSDSSKEFALSRGTFYAYAIWNNGRSMRDIEAPNDFMAFMLDAISRINSIMNDSMASESLKRKALKFLCVLHVDAFNYTSSIMRDAVYSGEDEKFNRYCSYLPYVMGNLTCPEQNQLFASVLERTGDKALHPLKVLSILAWRSDCAIRNLTFDEAHRVCEDLINELGVDYDRLTQKVDPWRIQRKMQRGLRGNTNPSRDEVMADERRQQCAILVLHLELLLALIRTRKSSDRKVRQIFQLGSDFTRRFSKAVRAIGNMILERKYVIKTRLPLDIKKPDGNRLPDLLYVLQLYLAGSTGAEAVSIGEISYADEDED